MILHVIDLRIDLFLVSFISLQFACLLLKAFIEINQPPIVGLKSITGELSFVLCARARVVCESECMSELGKVKE